MSDQAEHVTVLLNEAVEALVTHPDGCFIDCTFGRGGHSRKILESLDDEGRLIAMDKDPAAQSASVVLDNDSRFTFVRCSFAEIVDVAEQLGCLGKVTGVLLDLGVSSPQLDDASRGFSFLRDGPLDMRMDPEQGKSAAEWLAEADEKDIARVLKDYGEERYARRMARAIVAERRERPITRTAQLAELVAAANPSWEKGKHPATRAFQAIRIFINRELDDLQAMLRDVLSVLAPGGRLVVISFHSLEDRIVKQFMRDQSRGKPLPRGLPILEKDIKRPMRLIGKAVKASEAEINVNPRARSAVMRVAEKRLDIAA